MPLSRRNNLHIVFINRYCDGIMRRFNFFVIPSWSAVSICSSCIWLLLLLSLQRATSYEYDWKNRTRNSFEIISIMEVTCLVLFLVCLRYSVQTLLIHHQLYKSHPSQSEESYYFLATDQNSKYTWFSYALVVFVVIKIRMDEWTWSNRADCGRVIIVVIIVAFIFTDVSLIIIMQPPSFCICIIRTA